jgi:alpha-galactosidase
MTPSGTCAQSVKPEEIQKRNQWVQEWLLDSRFPFSFVYGGRPAGDLLKTWPKSAGSQELDDIRTQHFLTWTDPETALEVGCVAVTYADSATVEWTVHFKNTGTGRTPILENIQALDTEIEGPQGGEFVLHHWRGDYNVAPDLYEPLVQTLSPGTDQRFASVGGRSCNGRFPYFNLQMPGSGLLLAVGWPGQWATAFVRDTERSLRIVAGQELTHLYLKPGEEIRTPLIALLFWQGTDTVRAQNLWRRWMIGHNLPRTADGELPPPLLFGNTSLHFYEMVNANEENQKRFIDRYQEELIELDYWWMDAGWYPCGGRWQNTGTWEPDTVRFPNGLRAISDHARAKGVKTLVWFEPERVADKTWLAKNHPEWLLDGKLLNLGNAEARDWLTDHVDRVLREQGIDLYRQDFNMDPLDHWRNNDAPDRQGITENLHVQGYLAYWDELRRRHPNLIIDSCASGGRRNDLETLRRAVALHPTDYDYTDLAAKQAFHRSLFHWIPYFGSNTMPIDTVDAYAFRSGHGLAVGLGYDLRLEDLDYSLLRELVEQWRLISPCYYGDFYPLTPYSIAEEDWMAWQFNRPEQGDGVVEAFRRAESEEATRILCLDGLDPAATYKVKDLDAGTTATVPGKDLMARGLSVEIKGKPGATAIMYKKLR